MQRFALQQSRFAVYLRLGYVYTRLCEFLFCFVLSVCVCAFFRSFFILFSFFSLLSKKEENVKYKPKSNAEEVSKAQQRNYTQRYREREREKYSY